MLVTGVYRFTPYDIELINQAIAYIGKRYSDIMSTDNLAQEVNMDLRKLQAGFKKLTQKTIHRYQMELREKNATEDLLNFRLSIKQIAYKHGFSSSSHFSRVFKKSRGITPQEYRDTYCFN